VFRPQSKRPSRELFGALIVGERAGCPSAVHVENRELRSVAGTGRIFGGATFVERDVAITNL
jgi:hypothetical protein